MWSSLWGRGRPNEPTPRITFLIGYYENAQPANDHQFFSNAEDNYVRANGAYLVAGGINDSVVVLVSVELLGVALDGDTTLALLLAGVEEVSEAEGGLAHLLGALLELGHLTLGDAAALEDKVAAGGGLASIDVSADDDGKMSLVRHGWIGSNKWTYRLQTMRKVRAVEARQKRWWKKRLVAINGL